jgi:hypothetical protein
VNNPVRASSFLTKKDETARSSGQVQAANKKRADMHRWRAGGRPWLARWHGGPPRSQPCRALERQAASPGYRIGSNTSGLLLLLLLAASLQRA